MTYYTSPDGRHWKCKMWPCLWQAVLRAQFAYLKANWLLKIKKKSIYHPEDISTYLLSQYSSHTKMHGWRAKKILCKHVAFRRLSRNRIPLISFSLPFPYFWNSHVFKRKIFYISTIYLEVQKAACGALSPTF